ncbi:CitMHS family transporter [Novosphingobium tardum]|uniref:CitMHS family transporter n=1 Tax=Novosphingobium tardum TaxID=1538021 RepID=A0ABV8RNG9_9SPHN
MLMWLGFFMIAVFMAAIMTQRLSALVALILVPVIFAVALGFGPQLGAMVGEGLLQVAPTAALILFAVLFFSIMMDGGLFEPLVRRIVGLVGDDPVRVVIGSAVMAAIVSLDGDGATTVLIVIGAFLPVYRRLRMNPMVLGVVLGSANTVMNIMPWGGPTARAAAATKADIDAVFLPLVPTIAAGILGTVAIAWWLGRSERARLARGDDSHRWSDGPTGIAEILELPVAGSRLRFWANLALTLIVLAMAVFHIAPLQLVFMAALAVGLLINFPKPADQRKRLAEHAENALPIVLLIFAAGVFTGVLNGTGMVQSMANGLTRLIPDGAEGLMGPLTGVLAVPLTFVLSNDAYYFGVLPVLAQTAVANGVSPLEIARASLLAQPTHALSPLVPALYLATGLLGVEVGAYQRFALKWALLLVALLVATATLTGAII